jgi:hypothetical protein
MAEQIDVEYQYSLKRNNKPARWAINKGKSVGVIVNYLGEIWKESQKYVEENDPEWDDFNSFLVVLQYYELSERLCIERANEGVRMKGRTRCKPNCCVEYPTWLMLYPNMWDNLRADYRPTFESHIS